MSQNKASFVTMLVFTLFTAVCIFILNLNHAVFMGIVWGIAVYGFLAMIADFWRWVR